MYIYVCIMYVFLLIIINHYSIFDTTYILSSKFLSISKVKMPLKKGNDYLNIYEITLLIGDCIRAFVFFKTMKVLITLTSLLLFGLRTQATRSPWSYNQDFDKGDVVTTRRQLFPQRTFVFDDAPELGELQYRRMHSKTVDKRKAFVLYARRNRGAATRLLRGTDSSMWTAASSTKYESYPTTDEECVKYNGCEYQGRFAGFNGKLPLSQVKKKNIVSFYDDNHQRYGDDDWWHRHVKGKVLEVRRADGKGEPMLVDILDTCGNKDCKNCCHNNANKQTGILLDFEVYTAKRFWGKDYKKMGGKGKVEFHWLSGKRVGSDSTTSDSDRKTPSSRVCRENHNRYNYRRRYFQQRTGKWVCPKGWRENYCDWEDGVKLGELQCKRRKQRRRRPSLKRPKQLPQSKRVVSDSTTSDSDSTHERSNIRIDENMVRNNKLNRNFWRFTQRPKGVIVKDGILRVKIRKGKAGGESGGSFKAQLKDLFPSEYVKLEYEVKFGNNFQWVHGGKLPGVCFADSNSGCATGSKWQRNAGSFRLMWRADGQAIGYAYLALTGPGDNAGRIAVQKQGRNSGLKEAVSFSEKSKSGLNLWYKSGRKDEALWFKKHEHWNRVTIELRMNNIGRQDGFISVTVNGHQNIIKNVVFRENRKVKFNLLNFVSFFGGSPNKPGKWASKEDTYVDFKNLEITTGKNRRLETLDLGSDRTLEQLTN